MKFTVLKTSLAQMFPVNQLSFQVNSLAAKDGLFAKYEIDTNLA